MTRRADAGGERRGGPFSILVRDLDDITFTDSRFPCSRRRAAPSTACGTPSPTRWALSTATTSARCMLTIFMLFAIRTEASVLRMLDGSPQTYLHDPIVKYLEERVSRST